MAVVIVNNTGGSITSGTTYVGGVAPTSIDSIAFTPTSGNLIVDALINISGIDFTNCVSVINFTQPLNLNNTVGHTHFVNLGTGGYTLSGTPEIKYADTFLGTAISLTSNGIPWNGILNLSCSTTNNNITLVDDWNQNGELISPSTIQCKFLGNTFNINGICNALRISVDNTSIINLNGNINLTGFLFYGGHLKYTGGICNIDTLSVVPTSTVILDIAGVTINNLVNISSSVAVSIQLNSVPIFPELRVSSSSFPISFIGDYGFIADLLFIGRTTFNRQLILNSNVEYVVNDTIDITNASISSCTPGVKSKLTLGQNINQKRLTNIDATDIDSSGGRRVNNFFGTATNCDNWRIWTDCTLPQVSSTF